MTYANKEFDPEISITCNMYINHNNIQKSPQLVAQTNGQM